MEFQCQRSLIDIDKIKQISTADGYIANPGPFTGEIDSFELDPVSFRHQAVFDRLADYRHQIKALSGIKVYRDGFRVRVDHDWLKLGAQWTSATSYYGLKPDNTSGFIALSALANMELEEMTDREGQVLITSQKTRDQRQNLEDARTKLQAMIRASMLRPKKRKPTKPSKGAQERRMKQKREVGAKKASRKSVASD